MDNTNNIGAMLKWEAEFMKQIVAKFSKENIILATDDDREGEAIACGRRCGRGEGW